MRKDRWINLQYTYSINQSKIKVCFSIVFLVHFHRWQEPKNSRGLLPSPNWSWCCPMQTQMLRGVFSCGTEQNQEKRQPSIGWHLVINNTIKMANLEPCFKWEPPSDTSRPPRRPQASLTMPTDHRQGLYPASDLHLILIMPHFLLFL